jgi:hypothetical protein
MQIQLLPQAVSDVETLFELFGGTSGFQPLLPLMGWPIASQLSLFSTCTSNAVTEASVATAPPSPPYYPM